MVYVVKYDIEKKLVVYYIVGNILYKGLYLEAGISFVFQTVTLRSKYPLCRF